ANTSFACVRNCWRDASCPWRRSRFGGGKRWDRARGSGSGSASSSWSTPTTRARWPMAVPDRTGWEYGRRLTPPRLLPAVLPGWLGFLLYSRAQWWQESDENNLREWLNESPIFRATLPELVRDYLEDPENPFKAEEVYEQLKALCVIPRVFGEQLPLFP